MQLRQARRERALDRRERDPRLDVSRHVHYVALIDTVMSGGPSTYYAVAISPR